MSTTKSTTDFIYAGLFAALIAIMGFISFPLPFSPVPVSAQTLAIMLVGSILTIRQSFFSVLTFLLIGAIGVPVFAGAKGGIGILLGPTGGYLIGFLVGATMIAWIKNGTHSLWRLALANSIGGILVVYTLGVSWFSIVTQIELQKAIMVGALPFIPGDLFKVFAATIIASSVNKKLLKSRTIHN